MNKYLLIFSLLIFSSKVMSDASLLNEVTEVNNAIAASEACYHWAGEIGDQSPERNKQIEQDMKRDCPPAEKLLSDVFAKYPNNEKLFTAVFCMQDAGHLNISQAELNRVRTKEVISHGC